MTAHQWITKHLREDTAFGDLARDLRWDLSSGCATYPSGHSLRSWSDLRDHVIEKHQPCERAEALLWAVQP